MDVCKDLKLSSKQVISIDEADQFVQARKR